MWNYCISGKIYYFKCILYDILDVLGKINYYLNSGVYIMQTTMFMGGGGTGEKMKNESAEVFKITGERKE